MPSNQLLHQSQTVKPSAVFEEFEEDAYSTSILADEEENRGEKEKDSGEVRGEKEKGSVTPMMAPAPPSTPAATAPPSTPAATAPPSTPAATEASQDVRGVNGVNKEGEVNPMNVSSI